MSPSIIWFRHDLRLEDNPAFDAAVEQKGPVIPVFIWAPGEEATWTPGESSNWWLHHSLLVLQKNLQEMGLRLIIRKGESLRELQKLIRKTNASSVFWNRRYEPAIVARDALVKSELNEWDIYVESFNASLIFEPWEIENKSKKPFKVFTPFWNHYREIMAPPVTLPKPTKAIPPKEWPSSLRIEDLELEPFIDWAGGITETWTPGEDHALAQLDRFIQANMIDYDTNRNIPSLVGTSRLSPHLHFGEISPRQVWVAVEEAITQEKNPGLKKNGQAFLREIAWREFAYHLLFHFPNTAESPLVEKFENFPWEENTHYFSAWKKGKTGYPIVDAGMRELWSTGWMHNRVRMIAASFLVKDLLIPWQQGSRWFWDTLVDADLANNTLGWQWTAGCGADAAPYFRVFNPVLQGEKFDRLGDYVRRWLPELSHLPTDLLHKPWEASTIVLQDAHIELGETYPFPIVDHRLARNKALEAFAMIK
jgi:deoxyribodipyrimidine photo-lyase